MTFERYVNSKDNQTAFEVLVLQHEFERYVNSKDNQTNLAYISTALGFERYVNSKDNQTYRLVGCLLTRLRDM